MRQAVKSLLYTLAALLYAVWLTFFGVVSTGMGHGKNTTDLWFMLAVSPLGAGFLIWIALGFFLSRPVSRRNKAIVAILLGAHYLGLIHYLAADGGAELPSFSNPSDRDFEALVLFGLPYLAGQVLAWTYLLRRRESAAA